ncbi:MAG: hypothetical protein WC650_05875 [Candidatus Doudnabacteria bacterium]
MMPIFARGEEAQGTQVFVVSGKLDKVYQWLLNNPRVVIKISKNGADAEATLYPESASYAAIYISFSGYAAKSGDEISVGVYYDGLRIWSKSYKTTPENIAQAGCTINIEPTITSEEKTQLIVVGGHIDETIHDLLLTTTIIVELNGVKIPAEIHENMTYTATFITFGGYVAGIGDVVTISMDKNGLELFSKKHILTQTEINEKACIIDLGLSSTAISPRKICSTTWGALKR